MNRWETQLRKGLAELAVLAAIGRGETYGYRIVEQLQKLEGLELTESTVYPVLTRSPATASSPFAPTRHPTVRRAATIDLHRPDKGACASWQQVGKRFLNLSVP